MASISDAALLEGADHLGQSVALLALVQSRLAMLSKLRRFEPVQHEEGPLDAPEFLQGEIELVLALEGSQTLEHRGCNAVPAFSEATRRALGPAIALVDNSRRRTVGPENRYRTVLFVEKEGFHRQIQQAQIQERFDVMLMSTKGMSVVAARKLLDDLAARVAAGRIEKILVAHDFDVSGFGIFATLGMDSRRYTFSGRLPLIDIGLRRTDIEEMNLVSEPVAIQNWEADAERLALRGATEAELDFMAPNKDNQGQRVELNAMTAPQFIAFLERKLTQHGAGKVLPNESVLAEHAARILEREAAARWLATMPRTTIPAVPDGLVERVRALLAADPTQAWDDAVALLLKC
jgi:hypothetical protein